MKTTNETILFKIYLDLVHSLGDETQVWNLNENRLQVEVAIDISLVKVI